MDAGEVLARGIARLREQRGLTQERFAEVVGVSATFAAKLEQGAKAPSLATINDICHALGVRPSELFAAGEAARAELSKPEADVLRAFERVPADRQRAVVTVVEAVARIFPEQVVAKSERGKTRKRGPVKRRAKVK